MVKDSSLCTASPPGHPSSGYKNSTTRSSELKSRRVLDHLPEADTCHPRSPRPNRSCRLGEARHLSCWWGTRVTGSPSGRYPPRKVRRWPRNWAANLWRRQQRAASMSRRLSTTSYDYSGDSASRPHDKPTVEGRTLQGPWTTGTGIGTHTGCIVTRTGNRSDASYCDTYHIRSSASASSILAPP